MTILVSLVAVLAIAALSLWWAWPHRCPEGDPLCTRYKPCRACYRKLFKAVEFSGPGVGHRKIYAGQVERRRPVVPIDKWRIQ